jgi:hypothetical protein
LTLGVESVLKSVSISVGSVINLYPKYNAPTEQKIPLIHNHVLKSLYHGVTSIFTVGDVYNDLKLNLSFNNDLSEFKKGLNASLFIGVVGDQLGIIVLGFLGSLGII